MKRILFLSAVMLPLCGCASAPAPIPESHPAPSPGATDARMVTDMDDLVDYLQEDSDFLCVNRDDRGYIENVDASVSSCGNGYTLTVYDSPEAFHRNVDAAREEIQEKTISGEWDDGGSNDFAAQGPNWTLVAIDARGGTDDQVRSIAKQVHAEVVIWGGTVLETEAP